MSFRERGGGGDKHLTSPSLESVLALALRGLAALTFPLGNALTVKEAEAKTVDYGMPHGKREAT